MRYYLAAAAALALQVSGVQAETIVALIGNDVLATIDTRLNKTTSWTKIEGVGPVVGIDVRPLDGQLYALTGDGIIATVDPASGLAKPISTLEAALPKGVKLTVDFNPVADKMRIIGTDGTNLRVNVNDGAVTTDKTLTFAQTDPASIGTPMVIAGAYSNSVKGAKETTLYDIDGTLGGLFRQAPPNDGILNSIGSLGLDAENVAFDITTDMTGVNTGILLAKGMLYSVDLATGQAQAGKAVAKLPSDVRDIAMLPVMGTKQTNSDMMSTGRMPMKTKAEATPGYLPKAMPMMPKAVSPKKAAHAKTSMEKKSQSRSDHGTWRDDDDYADDEPRRNFDYFRPSHETIEEATTADRTDRHYTETLD